MGFMKKTIFALLVLIFLGATISDIGMSVRSYLKYEADIITKFVTPIGSYLPMVTFCGPKAQFVSDKYYEEKFGHPPTRPLGPEEINSITDFLSDMSIDKQFEVLYSEEDLKGLIKWHVIHDDRGPFHWADQVHASLNSDLFCFTLEHDFEHRYFSHGNEYDPAMTFQLSFKMPEILAYVHNSGEFILDLKEHKYQVISLLPKKITILNYELTILNLLPAPFETKCRRYEMQGPNSYYRLYNDYIKNGFINKYNCLPDNYLILFESRNELKICANVTIEQSFLDKLFYAASKHVQNECEQEYYSIQQEKGFPSPKDNLTDVHTIKVYPEELNKYIIYVPEMQFMELINNVVDEVCEWLAFLCVFLLISIMIERKSKKQMDAI